MTARKERVQSKAHACVRFAVQDPRNNPEPQRAGQGQMAGANPPMAAMGMRGAENGLDGVEVARRNDPARSARGCKFSGERRELRYGPRVPNTSRFPQAVKAGPSRMHLDLLGFPVGAQSGCSRDG